MGIYAGIDCSYNSEMKATPLPLWWLTAIPLWITQFSVLVSGNAVNFALIWQLTTITHSAQTLSLLAALTLVPRYRGDANCWYVE
jgi:hypothetical protein